MIAQRSSRRSTAVLTATVLGVGLVGLTAAPAFAADVADETALNAAIAADEAVITITADFTLSGGLATIDHDVQIVGNGHTITAAGFDAFVVTNASVTIDDLTVTGAGDEAFFFELGLDDSATLSGVSSSDSPIGIKAELHENASLTVTGGSHQGNDSSAFYVEEDSGEVSVSITGTSIEDAHAGIDLNGFSGTSTASIDGVTITDVSYTGIDFSGTDQASLEVTDVELTAGEDYNDGAGIGMYLYVTDEASVTVSDSSVSASSEDLYFYEGIESYQSGSASIEISDTVVTGNGYNLYIDVYGDGSFSLLDSTVTEGKWEGVFLSNIVGTATISNTLIDGNGVEEDSSGLYVYIYDGGSLTVSDSTISNNGDNGIYGTSYDEESSVTVSRSTIAGNEYTGVYISAYNGSEWTFDSTTLSGNVDGGFWSYLYDGSTVTLIDSTISGNTPGPDDGWALWSGGDEGTLNVLHSTVTDNTGLVAFGVQIVTAFVSHSIIAGNHIDESGGYGDFWVSSDGADVTAEWSLIGELVDDSDGASYTQGDGVITGVDDPGLGPLADNGGPTLTHLLSDTSPALDTGNPAIVDEPEFDQRGLARIVGTAVDLGAVEVQAEPALAATGAESTGVLWIGGLLLLAGAGALAAVGRLRRRTA